MPPFRRLCVFCGSRSGDDPAFAAAARETGAELARRGTSLVYGGGSVGLMGVVADAVLEANGEVIGVIPHGLATKELLHPRVPDMRVVPDMHARKALMAQLADGFVALPGGYGTLEELFEVITWRQLGLHDKPIGLLDVGSFFRPMVAWVDQAIATGFIRAPHRELLVVETSPVALLDRLEALQAAPKRDDGEAAGLRT